MKHLIKFPLEDGSSILVEVNEPLSESEPDLLEPDDPRRRIGVRNFVKNMTQRTIQTSGQTFESAIGGCINPVAKAVIANVKSLDKVPSEVEVKFGLKFGADVSFIAGGNAEANYEITLKWKKEEIL